MKNKKFLITGGSGFIGTNLIDFLSNVSGVEILNIDIAKPKKKSHDIFWQELDIRDSASVKLVVNKFQPDAVIHLAARTDLRGLSLDDYSSNTSGTKSLLDALADLNFNGVAIFASSMYVCSPGYKPNNISDYAPHTIYGESKVVMEKIIRSNSPQYGWTIVRPTSIWGPWFGEPYFDFFKVVNSGKYFHIGGINTRKTYGYVGNVVQQLVTLVEFLEKRYIEPQLASAIPAGVVYLGDEPAYLISDWANEIARLRGRRILTLPKFVFVALGFLGDFLDMLNIKFPMTSFRLKNMSTDNVHDLSSIMNILPDPPFQRLQGTLETLKWIDDSQRSVG